VQAEGKGRTNNKRTVQLDEEEWKKPRPRSLSVLYRKPISLSIQSGKTELHADISAGRADECRCQYMTCIPSGSADQFSWLERANNTGVHCSHPDPRTFSGLVGRRLCGLVWKQEPEWRRTLRSSVDCGADGRPRPRTSQKASGLIFSRLSPSRRPTLVEKGGRWSIRRWSLNRM